MYHPVVQNSLFPPSLRSYVHCLLCLTPYFCIPNSFPGILSPIPTPMPNFKTICQHLQIVERELKGLRTQTRCNIHTGIQLLYTTSFDYETSTSCYAWHGLCCPRLLPLLYGDASPFPFLFLFVFPPHRQSTR
jgi:hypothetical protein